MTIVCLKLLGHSNEAKPKLQQEGVKDEMTRFLKCYLVVVVAKVGGGDGWIQQQLLGQPDLQVFMRHNNNYYNCAGTYFLRWVC